MRADNGADSQQFQNEMARLMRDSADLSRPRFSDGVCTPMFKSNVSVGEHTVTKTGDPHATRVEVEKTVRAARIGQACGLFQVPEVLDYDEAKGRVVLQRLHQIRPVREIFAFEQPDPALSQTIGAALAVIHRELRLPADMIVPLPHDLNSPHCDVFVHGDYTVDNVFVNPVGPSIAVLDWQMTRVHGGTSTYGTRYFDLAWFINTLFSRPMHRYLLSKPATPIAQTFLRGYFAVAGSAYENTRFASYMTHFVVAKVGMRRRTLSWRQNLVLVPSHARWRTFAESLRV